MFSFPLPRSILKRQCVFSYPLQRGAVVNRTTDNGTRWRLRTEQKPVRRCAHWIKSQIKLCRSPKRSKKESSKRPMTHPPRSGRNCQGQQALRRFIRTDVFEKAINIFLMELWCRSCCVRKRKIESIPTHPDTKESFETYEEIAKRVLVLLHHPAFTRLYSSILYSTCSAANNFNSVH